MSCHITKIYAPQIFAGLSGYTAPPASGPTFTNQGNIELTYPFVSPTTTLQIESPEFNNGYTLNPVRQFNRSRNNKLIIVRDSSWPTIYKLNYSIVGVTQANRDLLETFINDSLGKEIGLRDYENQQWKGFVLNPELEFNEQRRTCGFTLNFEFDGEVQ